MTPQSEATVAESDEKKELLPCPFCGAKHVRPHEKRAGNHTSADKHYSIRCGVCTFNGPRGLSAEQAVEAWNRRTPPQSQGGADAVTVPRETMERLRLTHHNCEDSWYSCPKHEDGCADERQTECNCGADSHNAIIDAALTGGKGE